MMRFRPRMLAAAAVLALGASGALLGITRKERPLVPVADDPPLKPVAVLGKAEGAALFRVKGVAFLGGEVVVLTGADPAVHVFGDGLHRGWGAKGNGPAEFSAPEELAVQDGHILVRDGTLEKIVSFDPSGRHVATRNLRPNAVNRFETTVGDTILGLTAHHQSTRAVARLRGERLDTLVRYDLPGQLRLSAPGSPPLTLPGPFAPLPRWTALRDGRVAFWDGHSGELSILGGRGAAERLPLPSSRFAVGAAEREEWLNNGIPRTFMGQPLFESLRKQARETVAFPDSLPPVLDLMADPVEGVWVRRTTQATGERWTWVGPDGVGNGFHLPIGTRLLAMGRTRMAALAVDGDEVETVQLFTSPSTKRR